MNRLARAVIDTIEPVGAPADVNVLEAELGADHAKIGGSRCARTRSTSHAPRSPARSPLSGGLKIDLSVPAGQGTPP